MDKLRATLLVSMGIFASGSGIIQVSAADFYFEEDFSSKEVINFDDFTPSFNEDTSNLTLSLDFYFFGEYQMSSCPSGNEVQGMRWEALIRANGTGSNTIYTQELPDLPCANLGFATYEAFLSIELDNSFLDLVVLDDSFFIEISPRIYFLQATTSTTITLRNWYVENTLNYNFNTTYLFNYFLSDQQYNGIPFFTSGWSFGATQNVYLEYVYTTAGNDRYFIFNSNINSIGTTRKKYAIDYENEYFRGQSVGSNFIMDRIGTDTVTTATNDIRSIRWSLYYNFLNVSNKEQDISNVPEFDFEYEDCGSFLALNVPCFINNGLAYVVNDAPVISDAFTLLNAGMKLGGQAFSIIGQFTDNNLFGVLVLGGLGITAVRWFLKQD
jgi:hypothetical protein